MEDDWITTVQAAQILNCSYDKARTVLLRLDAARRASQGNRTIWRRDDVLAAVDLAKLGIPKRTPRTVAPKPTTAPEKLRPCLCCSRPFASEGIHNRLCDTCLKRAPGMLEYGNAGGRNWRR